MALDAHLAAGTYLVQKCDGLKGDIRLPGDKSISHRAVMLASLSHGETTIYDFLESEDCLATLNAFKSMGIHHEIDGHRLIIEGNGLWGLHEPDQVLDMGNSGTGTRLLLGVLAGQKFSSVLTGDSSLRKRPMKRVTDPLSQMGAKFSRQDEPNELPLQVHGGEIHGIQYKSPVASAQIKSAILLAALFAEGTTEIEEPTLSRDHSERMLETFGITITRSENRCVLRGKQQLSSVEDIMVPGDISSAAFFIVGASILPGSDLILREIGINPTRTGLLDVLKKMGANIALINQRYFGAEPVADIHITYSPLKGITVSGKTVVRMIDEFPIFAIAAACADSPTIVSEAEELRVKESDRISAMVEELKKLGVDIEEKEDGFVVSGAKSLTGSECFSHGDHRVAMSLIMAGLHSDGETKVNGTGSIATSFPTFLELIQEVSNGKVEDIS
jgi:3-phosphoshikimate 1-carboxyvinyltransferase